ncbi:hypothetical protein ACIBH1_36335 [Nonomuraea sp. NPDC050663]|uniref:hypothetical protein n=1 Tax=Nonomuraea sp. NPDC050663 TaxID=3364370 RepID=UPI0037BA892E
MVSVEVLMLLADHEGVWSYRRVTGAPAPGEGPDAAARRISGVRADDPACVVHSTSWRHLPEDDEIVLTYAVCPDPDPEAARIVLDDPVIARGQAPARPSPALIEESHVVAHAIQHLAFLRATDPVVQGALEQWPAIAMALTARSADQTLPSTRVTLISSTTRSGLGRGGR